MARRSRYMPRSDQFKTTTVRFDESTFRALDTCADALGVSMNSIVNEAVEKWLSSDVGAGRALPMIAMYQKEVSVSEADLIKRLSEEDT